MGKKIIRFMSGLPFGIVLLVLIAVYSIFGTLIPQGMPLDFYLSRYQSLRTIILLFGFNNAYYSPIFKILLILFSINLITCTFNFVPSKIKQVMNPQKGFNNYDGENLWEKGVTKETLKGILTKKGFSITENPQGTTGIKHSWGILGSTITHMGIILILLGALIGSFFAQEGYFTMLPGEELFFPGKDFRLKLEDFNIDFREDGSAQQYYSHFTVYKNSNKVQDKIIWVNNPMKQDGIGFYQSNFGWSGQLIIKDPEGNLLIEKYMKSYENHFFNPEHLSIYLFGFYPNFRIGHDGMPVTIGNIKSNPRFAVILYHFGEHVDSVIIEPGEEMLYEEYSITFDNPVLYTGITYRSDFGYPVVLLGFFALTLGLLIAFYFYPRYIFFDENKLYGYASKNSWGFQYWLKKTLRKDLNNRG